jgi:putative lipoprotein
LLKKIISGLPLLVLGAIAFSACGPINSDTGTVTGQVTYLERIALPPDAVVGVMLINASLADTQAAVISETNDPTEGGQVPIDFEIIYDVQKINPNNLYKLSASIRNGSGKLLFVTDEPVFVITNDNPSEDVELLLIQVQ